MFTTTNKITFILSTLVAVLAAIASSAGLFIPNLYHDNEFVQTAWYGNDWVTLLIVVPSLIASMLLSKNGSLKAPLIWMGLLGYLFYCYAFYLFGAVFNNFFLIYGAIFSISFFALIIGLSSLTVQNIVCTSKIIRWVSAYLLLIAIMLCVIEVPPCISFITESKMPDIVTKTNLHTSIVYALDLSLIVPSMFIAAILLWKNKSWGIVLSVMMLVKAFTYGLVLDVGTLLLAAKDIKDPLLPVWIFITLGGLSGLILLLKRIQPASLSIFKN